MVAVRWMTHVDQLIPREHAHNLVTDVDHRHVTATHGAEERVCTEDGHIVAYDDR